ncbi:hypothetical protein CHARACLAT_017903 [Characodon lateralis]|uniref:Uncharacterized protein n=1 Tax=Characodon lateralis TaxID=208331 RepID=A0ABU7F3Y6_9TELE|nr:hypothetical protein [Characodon lateralis]
MEVYICKQSTAHSSSKGQVDPAPEDRKSPRQPDIKHHPRPAIQPTQKFAAASGSMNKANSDGESGLPCLLPLSRLKL